MNRTQTINALISKINAETYLEIGVFRGTNFKAINCKKKVGVDPSRKSPATHHQTSDNFFKTNKDMFDVVFIDGLHHAEQTEKDILNALEFLNEGGFIVCHDINPPSEASQRVPRETPAWNGDCWKAWVKLRSERSDLEMFVVDTGHLKGSDKCGCGIIQKGSQEVINIEGMDLTWKNLDKLRVEWLNLISAKEFVEKYGL